MHMIRHDHVSAYGPAMTLMRDAPFPDQNLGDLILRQHCTTIFRAHGDEINRRIHPDSIQSAQMFMHRLVVADVVDLGEPEMLPPVGVAAVNDLRLQSPRENFRSFRLASAIRRLSKCLDSFSLLMRKEQLPLLSAQRTTHNR